MITLILARPDGSRESLAAPEGLSVMEVLRNEGVSGIGECNGSLACATCHVVVDPGWYDRLDPMSEPEEDMLDTAFNVTATSRLCCKIILKADLDGLTVRLPG